MKLPEYRTCMSSRMKGNLKDLSPTERKIIFATSAKICSGKAKDEKNAIMHVKIDHPEWFDER